MDFLLTLLLLGLGTLAFLAISPLLIGALGFKLLHNWSKPYAKRFRSLEQFQHPSKPFFLRDIAHTAWFMPYMKPENDTLSVSTKAVILSFFPENQRFLYIKRLKEKEREALNTHFRKQKKAKATLFQDAQNEILQLLEKDVHGGQASDEALLFYQYDDLYESIKTLQSLQSETNHVIRHLLQVIIQRSLRLFPYFERYQLFELNHKFKTLLTHDLIESVRSLQRIDPSKKTDREAELYGVLKSILAELDDIESSLQQKQDHTMERHMRVLKQKFKQHADEE